MFNFMKNAIFLGFFLIIPFTCFANTNNKNRCSDLQKKTARGFIVPYSLRYDSEVWSCKSLDGGHEFISFQNRQLALSIIANKEEKNLSKDCLDSYFKISLEDICSDSSLYSSFEIKPSNLVTINGINFLHQRAILDLVPNSIHFKRSEVGNYVRKIKVPEKGSQAQLDYYTYSGDKGLILFIFRSENILNQEDQATIDELFRGFSFDGSACRGNKGLRSLKTAFEFLTDK